MGDVREQAAVELDLRRLRGLLDRGVASVARPALAGKTDLSVLDVACGACDEAATLSDFFASLRGSSVDDRARTVLVGTDVRERELEQARSRFRSTAGRGFEFFKGDGSKLHTHRQLREVFDVVFIRHQNLYNGRRLWRRIFEQALDRLDPNGLLVITSYFDREHALALDAFSELGAEVVTSIHNPDSRALPAPGKSVDRHLAVLRRPQPDGLGGGMKRPQPAA